VHDYLALKSTMTPLDALVYLIVGLAAEGAAGSALYLTGPCTTSVEPPATAHVLAVVSSARGAIIVINREHVKGAPDKAIGAAKDMVGKVTGSKKMQAEGKAVKVKGAAHTAVGNVKDAAGAAPNKVKRG
jgi:uncharacterized protein YjbJ (UPF0337 family)